MRMLALLVCLAVGMPVTSMAATKSAKPARGKGTVTNVAGPLDFGTLIDPPTNDLCSGAILIPCGNIDLSGHTGLANNDYSPSDSSCTGYLAEGNDVVYKMEITAGDSLWLDYGASFDGSLYIVTDCSDITGTCVAGQDTIPAVGVEEFRYRFTSSGTFYLILDAFGAGPGGSWTASGQLICGSTPLPPNDVCANAIPLLCGPINLSGTTEFALDDYGFPSAGQSCTGQLADGRDVVYRVNATAGDSLWIDYTSTTDGSVYVLTQCDNSPASCVAGVDATGTGETEQLRYTFDFSGPYYIVFDSRGANTFGDWVAIGGVECGLRIPENDICLDAIDIPCGDISLSGSTELAINNYYFFSELTSCTDYLTNGNDIVYRIDAQAGDSLWADYSLMGADATMYIVTNCQDLVNSCVVGVDNNLENEPEFLRFKFDTTGTYYLILDAYDLNAWGDWTLVGGRICSTTGVGDARGVHPISFSGAYPNPFRTTTLLEYTLPLAAHTSLRVYDLQGRRVRELFDGLRQAGQHRTTWDGRDDQGIAVGAGVYFAQLVSDGKVAMRRLIFVR